MYSAIIFLFCKLKNKNKFNITPLLLIVLLFEILIFYTKRSA